MGARQLTFCGYFHEGYMSHMTDNPRRRRLKTMGNLRAMVAQTLRDLETGKMEPEKARAVCYGAQILGKLIEGEDLEKRLRELERQKGARGGAAGEDGVPQ